jgi:hypothetical protein
MIRLSMNHELVELIRSTGYLSDAGHLSAQNRYDLLTHSFWQKVAALGYNVTTLKRLLWRVAGRPEEALIAILPEAPIQKAVHSTEREKDPRKRIKETAAAIALLYRKAEKEIQAAISRNMEQPDRMRAETGRIRRTLLSQAASWLGVAIPGLYLAGSRIGALQGPHTKAAQALVAQEFNRFKEVDAQIGRHVEEVIAEAEKRRTKAALAQTKADYVGLRGGIIGHKTIDGKELGLGDYVAMLAITAARNTFNEGASNAILGRGEDLALISREIRPNTCAVCREWAGKIVSISGKSKEYPALDTAIEEGLLHPNCIHHLLPVNYEGST